MENNIDPRELMTKEEFCTLFEHLPLNDEEAYKIQNVYWALYEKLSDHPEVPPVQAWLATKNTFIETEAQVGERMQEQK